MKMVERVARASFAAWAKVRDKDVVWEDMPDFERQWSLTHAREMIKAMREPTGEMRDAGAGVYDTIAGQPSRTWHAMIDEALK